VIIPQDFIDSGSLIGLINRQTVRGVRPQNRDDTWTVLSRSGLAVAIPGDFERPALATHWRLKVRARGIFGYAGDGLANQGGEEPQCKKMITH
jgi:hypothetical protein